MTLYLDTSALLKLYLTEVHQEVVKAAVAEASSVATSTVAYAEARAALARRWREGDLSAEEHRRAVNGLDQDWPKYQRVVVNDDVVRLAGAIAEELALRGFDAIHLASALQLHRKLDDMRFLAFDNRLMQAARQVVPLRQD